jgi:hypothetical protein
METLGFSDAASQWSDGPPTDPNRPPGPPLAVTDRPGSLADWKPEEVRRELDRGNFRWSILIVLAVIIASLGYFGYWLFQRPAAQTETAMMDLEARAAALADSLPALEEFNDSLILPDPGTEPVQLSELENAARSLFNTSAELPEDRTAARSAAVGAAETALDGIRLTRGAHAYRLAVAPLLVTPDLETDPVLIALDEAARSFGDWQLQFDQVRSALPDQVLPEVTERMGLLSTELTDTMTAYVDALRADDMAAAESVLTGLDMDLDALNDFLVIELDAVQEQVELRIAETKSVLAELTS